MESGIVSTALMSVVDYQESQRELFLLPAGMIGCDGPTLTVRIYSKVPPTEISVVHGDTDSHTSVVLAQVILAQRYGRSVRMLSHAAHEGDHRGGPETMLLIGDKVVNAAPDSNEYRYQLDLGEEWKALTGLPFVFAMWMMRRDMVDMELAQMLAEARAQGAAMTERLLDRHCAEKGWPRDLARQYFTEYLRYEVTDRARLGLVRFFDLAGKQGLLQIARALNYLELS